jgi:hypothetical protein
MSGIRRRDGRPQWIDEERGSVHSLTRVDLAGRSGSKFDEAWLQNLLHAHPDVFPVEQIEPGFGRLIPLCRELAIALGAGRSGNLDNLYATSDGGLVLIEAKLWRNPEARRTVVAQAMEYAAAVFRMTYEQLESAVLLARKSEQPAKSLAEIVSRHTPDFDEAEFVDAVSRNLRRGRAIVAVVGDGIREDILPLAELLQSHAGHRFTFALVELGVYEAPAAGTKIVVPSVLAQTTLIERGVIRVMDESGRIDIALPSAVSAGYAKQSASSRRSVSIGEDEFYDLLRQKDATWPELLKAFFDKAEDAGLYVERQGGLNLKHASPVGRPLNLAAIAKEGTIDTSPTTWWDRIDAGRRYNEALAKEIGGVAKEIKYGTEIALRMPDGRMPRVSDLLPKHEDGWLRAIQAYVAEMFDGAESENS